MQSLAKPHRHGLSRGAWKWRAMMLLLFGFNSFLNPIEAVAKRARAPRKNNKKNVNVLGARSASPAQVRAQRHSSKGVALVIGNSSYKSAPLRNPISDATAIGENLRDLGYQTQILTNADFKPLKKSIVKFSKQMRGAEIGLFYYAGHGIQYKGKNYLIPVDANIQTEEDIAIEGVDMGYVFGKMAAAKAQVNIIILDACRNNPFERSWSGGGQGLAVMDAPAGSLVAYATAPGQVALDGDGLDAKHSVYTAALLDSMRSDGASIEEIFKDVRRRVRESTNGKQIPWESTSLEGDVVLKPGGSLRRKSALFVDEFAKQWPQIDDAKIPMQTKKFDTQQAQAICQYLPQVDNWSCNPKGLQDFPVLHAGQLSTAGEIEFLPLAKDKSSCTNAVMVRMRDPKQNLTINWDLATFVVNGTAKPARVRLENAGFKVQERQSRGFKSVSSAPKGTQLQAVLTLPDGSCLLPNHLQANTASATLDLVLPFLLGETRHSSKWRAEWRRQNISLVEGLALVPRPVVAETAPAEPGLWLPVWSLGAAGFSTLAATAFGLYVANAWLPASTGTDLQPRLLAGSGYGACALGCLLLPTLPVGLFVDSLSAAGREGARKDYEDYLLSQRQQAAYDRIVGPPKAQANVFGSAGLGLKGQSPDNTQDP